jgi:hypothetical protein
MTRSTRGAWGFQHVPDDVVQDEGVAIVADEIGAHLLAQIAVAIPLTHGCGWAIFLRAVDRERADFLLHGNSRGLKAPRARHHDDCLERATNDHVGAAPGDSQVEPTLGVRRTHVRLFERATHPRDANGQAHRPAGRIEIMHGDEKLRRHRAWPA